MNAVPMGQMNVQCRARLTNWRLIIPEWPELLCTQWVSVVHSCKKPDSPIEPELAAAMLVSHLHGIYSMFLKQQSAEILVVNLDFFHAEGVQLPADFRPGILSIIELLPRPLLCQLERLPQAFCQLSWRHLGIVEPI